MTKQQDLSKFRTLQLLPQGFTYKPPINIRLLDQRANGFTPLVGKYVLKSFSQYDPEYLKKKLAAAEAEGSSTTEESEGILHVHYSHLHMYIGVLITLYADTFGCES